MGVATFLYDQAASALLDQPRADAWKKASLQNDLLHHLDKLFALIYPPASDDRDADPRCEMHFCVALSFADGVLATNLEAPIHLLPRRCCRG